MCLSWFTSRHVFVVWYKNHCKNETKTSACWEHRLWRSLHVEVLVSYLQWFLYQMAKMWRDVNVWRHIQLCLDLYITRRNKIHDSKTCVWTQHQPLQGMFKKYLTMHYFQFPRHTQTMTAYMILTEYVCESWECLLTNLNLAYIS